MSNAEILPISFLNRNMDSQITVIPFRQKYFTFVKFVNFYLKLKN